MAPAPSIPETVTVPVVRLGRAIDAVPQVDFTGEWSYSPAAS